MNARRVSTLLVWVLALQLPYPANAAQFGGLKKRIIQVGACGGGAFAGVKIGDKVAEMEAKRLKLSPEEAKKHLRAYQIGMALALCGGGAAIAGTSYDKMSKRGKDAREKEINAALEDAMPTPHMYSDPDNASLTGTAIAQPAFMADNNKECRVVQDQLGADQSLVKYCRTPGGMWAVET
jgi:hypothetical protein